MRPVNLLPESQRRHEPGAQPGSAYAVLGVLAVLFLMSAVYVFTANQAASRESDAADASAEADGLEARARQLGGFGDFAQVKEARAASVRQLAAGRFDWERLIRELARVLPARSWLQDVEASVTGEVDGSSGAAAAAAGSTAASPQAHLTGCTPKQSDVAALMLRLRRMHRVEDVTLGESAREDTGAAPSLDSCGRFYQFDLTVMFAATPLPEEAPAGETRVPASLGGGS